MQRLCEWSRGGFGLRPPAAALLAEAFFDQGEKLIIIKYTVILLVKNVHSEREKYSSTPHGDPETVGYWYRYHRFYRF